MVVCYKFRDFLRCLEILFLLLSERKKEKEKKMPEDGEKKRKDAHAYIFVIQQYWKIHKIQKRVSLRGKSHSEIRQLADICE